MRGFLLPEVVVAGEMVIVHITVDMEEMEVLVAVMGMGEMEVKMVFVAQLPEHLVPLAVMAQALEE